MGHHNIRFDGDPYALVGAWSPPTSRANFCEEDYVLTFYLTEFVNSVTNVAYVYYALCYMYGPGSRGLLAPRLDAMSIALLFLGIGSFLFHATLRKTLEFADEFSMLGLTWSMLHVTFSMQTTPPRRRAASAALAVGFVSFAVFYLRSPKIIYQVMAFVFTIVVLILRTNYLLHWSRPAFAPARRRDWVVRTWKAIGLSVLAYVLWNIDLEFCAELRRIRQRVGLPWAWLFELHGWWHVLTAMGTSRFMDVAREMRREDRAQRKRA
ncbi:hypothetical protein E4U42_004174 [Claviceps africana]|uniref:Uncharacterized protein n=1 Tax=Claviceps africana TaxID=83212 RepID=A0A8K0JEB4_9HYPO|nr:hypothetical protein E4U42_004174 [Claviceps africana]